MIFRLFWIAAVCTAAAQNVPGPAGAAFEVASVRPSSRSGPLRERGSLAWGDASGKVSLPQIPLKSVLMRAYGVRAYQIAGPEWLASERYDIFATAPAGTTKEQYAAMYQNLLAERFSLQVHRHAQLENALALVVAKGGLRLRPAAENDKAPTESDAAEGAIRTRGSGENTILSGASHGPFGDFKLTMSNGILHYDFARMSMKMLAGFLDQGMTGYPVFDRTGVAGLYQVSLDVSTADMAAANGMPPKAETPDQGVAAASEPPGSSMLSSLRKLGLNLERRKAEVETLVIDRIEKVPTGN